MTNLRCFENADDPPEEICLQLFHGHYFPVMTKRIRAQRSIPQTCLKFLNRCDGSFETSQTFLNNLLILSAAVDFLNIVNQRSKLRHLEYLKTKICGTAIIEC